jgi:hypothetical protein
MADGTETHSVYPTQNVVKVAMAYDENTGKKRILSIGVNTGWRDAERKTPKDAIVISDAEEEIPFYVPHSDLQLDLHHAVRDSLYRMWMYGSSRSERERLSMDMKRVLYALVNSVRKHLEDGDLSALSRMVASTIQELDRLPDEMEGSYLKTAAFIRSHAGFMVTFAKVALDRGSRCPTPRTRSRG